MKRALAITAIVLTALIGYTPIANATPKPTPAEQPRHEINVYLWYHEINQQAEFARAMDRLAAWMRAQSTYRSGQCGGSLPPCYVMMRESRGNITAQNPHSTASGKWQFLTSTWRRIPASRGYARARDAPEQVQDNAARQLWAGGRGCSHWSACG